MPLSSQIASTIKGLNFNLEVFGETAWDEDVRKRLIDESVGILDEIILDPVFNFTLQLAQSIRTEPPDDLQAILAGGKPLMEFLEKEEFLLRHHGLDEKYIELLIRETQAVLEKGLHGLASPGDVFKALVRLKFRLMEVRDKKAQRGWVPAARKLVLGLGGGVLVGLNASGLAVTVGISGPLATLSAAAGGTLMGEAMKAAYDALAGA